ncbi:carbohydrate sulfotransferase 15-like [Aplysia californica]|uniref:Carbohydrate sulfotransferase 15-like n=1 Tax=Aplysia californica TaxID=6500 RepID=A0ABM1VWD0_APLCA|nr:carbohydrate sulfotransferase 15-like [Aplysia californica]
MQVLGSHARMCWKHKWLFLAVGLTLYITIFIMVYTLTVASRLPPGKPLSLGTWPARPSYIPHLKNPCFFQQKMRLVQCVPYFHVLGVDKCGTTDFHSRLTSHPDVLENNGGLGKEIYYWCWLRYGLWMMGHMLKRRFGAYLGLFTTPTKKISDEYMWKKRQLITGDGTPMDFWDFRGWYLDPQNAGLDEPKFLTPHAMRHIYRNPKFFILLRDPAERLYSDYMFLGYGHSPQQFARDVPRAIGMMKACLAVNSTRQCFFSDDMYHKLPMRIHISCYSVFLREWLSVFNKKHFFIIRTEDYHADVAGTLLDAYEFLGVGRPASSTFEDVLKQGIKHETPSKKRAGKMLPETRALLDEFFARFNIDLAQLLQDRRFLWGTSEFSDG